MSTFAPTPDQERAIRHALEDACVIAGAGSGKTAVLTARYLELVLEHGLPARRVAALTFTEKAAAEMRDRITAKLADGGHHRIRDDVDAAPISTVHAFCARLLRLHAIDAGLDPAFTVLDETEALLLLEDAWTRTLERLGAEGSEDLGVLTEVGATDEDLRRFLERVRGAGAEVADLRWHVSGIDLAAARSDAERALADLLAEATAAGGEDRLRAEAVVESTREAIEAAGDDRAWRLDAARAVASGLTRVARKIVPPRKALVAALDDLVAAALDQVGSTAIAAPLVRVLAAVADSYRDLKHERGVLDFTDLEREALRLLDLLQAEGRPLARAPRALLVDEFQDTNPLQAAILHRLRHPGCPLFSVGDPKQSIYRFRRADVTVIQREHERVGEAGRHLLRATFRARPQLVDALNTVHASLFANGAAGVEHVPLSAEGAFRDVDGPDVELAIVDCGDDAGADVRREAEARWIARWIRDLVDRRVPRAKVERGGPGNGDAPRPLGYGDVSILFRARSSLSIYEEALTEAGIAFHTHKGRGYFQAEEVADLVHALRVIHDPADDHALACFLTGPVVGATDADLLRLFAGDGERRRRAGDAWLRLRGAEERAGQENERLGAVVGTVEALRREATAGRLGRVVEGVLYDLGLLEAALLQPDGPRRAANLRKAVAVARGLERSGRADLHELLRHLSLLREREVPEAEAALGREGEDVVVLNTVHGAKGLEYPVVVLADGGRRSPRQTDSIAFDEGAGGASDADPTFAVSIVHPLEGKAASPGGLAQLREREKEKAEEESRRLLYVALTRAEERLLIAGSCAGFTKGKGAKPKKYEGWGPALLQAFGGVPPQEGAEIAMGRGRARVRIVDPLAPPPRPRAVPPLGAASSSAADRAEVVLAEAAQPVAPLGDTPYVVTVSDLLHFAASPADAYARGLEGTVEAPPSGLLAGEPDDPASGTETADPEAARRAERRVLADDGPAPDAGDGRIDRAALGRALHALLERVDPARGGVREADVAAVLEEEGLEESDGDGAVADLLRAMVDRFVRSPSGRHLASALAEGADVRREMAFHARVRFPSGVMIGAHDALLVRGAIDLWLPAEDGIWIVDHKTNPRSRGLRTPADVGRHYDWQLRLYALAAERIQGEDVAGARLLLLDPSWGQDPPEEVVDVSGPALEDARRLCQAYAVAELEGRWPSDWRDLLRG